jgi:hypothetical protein
VRHPCCCCNPAISPAISRCTCSGVLCTWQRSLSTTFGQRRFMWHHRSTFEPTGVTRAIATAGQGGRSAGKDGILTVVSMIEAARSADFHAAV